MATLIEHSGDQACNIRQLEHLLDEPEVCHSLVKIKPKDLNFQNLWPIFQHFSFCYLTMCIQSVSLEKRTFHGGSATWFSRGLSVYPHSTVVQWPNKLMVQMLCNVSNLTYFTT